MATRRPSPRNTPIPSPAARRAVLALACAALLCTLGPDARAGDKKRERTASTGIQWFASWAQAKAEAARTQRPILLTAAAPHCRNISGMW